MTRSMGICKYWTRVDCWKLLAVMRIAIRVQCMIFALCLDLGCLIGTLYRDGKIALKHVFAAQIRADILTF